MAIHHEITKCNYPSIFFFFILFFPPFFSRVLRDSTPRFVGPSVHWSVRDTLLFLGFYGLWPYSSCPNDGVASNMAPAHPHATLVAVYPALFQKGNTIKKAHDTSATRKSDIRLSVSDNVLQPQYHGMITFRPITHIFGAICL